MPRHLAIVALVSIMVPMHPGSPAATKVKDAVSPGTVTSSMGSRARVLAGHGEWELAWEALQSETGRGSSDLGVAVLTRLGRAAAAESLLATRPLDDHTPAGRSFRSLQRARLQLEAGQVERALASLAAIDSADDAGYGVYRDLVLARACMAAGNPSRAASALDRVFRAGPPAAVRPEIDEIRIDVLLALRREPEALVVARNAVDGARDAATRARLLRRSYDIAVEAGDRGAATSAAKELFDRHQRSPEAISCAVDFVDRRAAAQAPGALLSCASVFQAHGRSVELRRALRLLDHAALAPREVESRRLLWGEYRFMKGDYSRAIALAQPAYTSDELRRRSMLLLARSLRRVGRGVDAATVYQAFTAAFPNDVLAAEALFTAASLHADAGNEAEADRLRDRVRRSYPSTFYGWAAAIERANSLERRGQGADAAAIYEQWLTRSKRTDEAALFYLARLRTNAGAHEEPRLLLDELTAVNPYSFYARPDVAAWARGPATTGDPGTRRAALSDWLASAESRREEAYRRVLASAGSVPAPERDAQSALARARRFLQAGFDDWAQGELGVVLREGPDDATEALRLARLFDESAMPWRSVRLYERARADMPWEERRAHADDFRYLTYPIPYPAQVFEASHANDVTPHLLYGLIREESRFETEAVSRAGAVGLMQLMPATASRIAAEMDLAWGGLHQLGSPEVNVAIGAWYAADLLRDGRGSVAWMLAAYNAGPEAAKRWIEPGTVGSAAIDAVESIDYRETRGYVKRVVESANVYHDLYFGGGGRVTGVHR